MTGQTPRVLWVSHAFGYGNDLMYYGEIFREFRKLVPGTEVVVDEERHAAQPFRNPYGIALRPILRQFRVPLRRRTPEGEVYYTELALPNPAFIARLVKAKADVIITIEFTLPALLAIASCALSSKRLVLLIESDPVARGASQNKWVRRLKRMAVQRADLIQTNNDKGRRYVIEDLSANPSKVRVAPYLTSRPPGPAARIEPHDGPVRILFANNIIPRKGLRQLLDAVSHLSAPTRQNIALTIVGDGDERAELEQQAVKLGLGDRLRFIGQRPYEELGNLYAESDVLAIPSLADYRSLAGFEGLGYGLALLSSQFDGATEETVIEGVNGFVINPHHPSSVAKRIEALVGDRTRLLAMRRASLDRYQRFFSIEQIARNLADSAHTALSGSP